MPARPALSTADLAGSRRRSLDTRRPRPPASSPSPARPRTAAGRRPAGSARGRHGAGCGSRCPRRAGGRRSPSRERAPARRSRRLAARRWRARGRLEGPLGPGRRRWACVRRSARPAAGCPSPGRAGARGDARSPLPCAACRADPRRRRRSPPGAPPRAPRPRVSSRSCRRANETPGTRRRTGPPQSGRSTRQAEP